MVQCSLFPVSWLNLFHCTELVAANHSNVTKDKLLEWQSTWQHFCDEELGYQVRFTIPFCTANIELTSVCHERI